MKSFIRTMFNAVYALSPIVILFLVSAMALRGNKGNDTNQEITPAEVKIDGEVKKGKEHDNSTVYMSLSPAGHSVNL